MCAGVLSVCGVVCRVLPLWHRYRSHSPSILTIANTLKLVFLKVTTNEHGHGQCHSTSGAFVSDARGSLHSFEILRLPLKRTASGNNTIIPSGIGIASVLPNTM